MKPLKLALMVWLNSQNHGREFIYVTFTKCLKWTIMSFSLCFNVFFFLKKYMKLMVDLFQMVYFPALSLFY